MARRYRVAPAMLLRTTRTTPIGKYDPPRSDPYKQGLESFFLSSDPPSFDRACSTTSFFPGSAGTKLQGSASSDILRKLDFIDVRVPKRPSQRPSVNLGVKRKNDPPAISMFYLHMTAFAVDLLKPNAAQGRVNLSAREQRKLQVSSTSSPLGSLKANQSGSRKSSIALGYSESLLRGSCPATNSF